MTRALQKHVCEELVSHQVRANDSDAVVLFGITGDLAFKKLFPALLAMVERGVLSVPIVGVALSDWTIDKLRARAMESVERHGSVHPAAFDKLASLLRYVRGDYRDPETYVRLRKTLGSCNRALHYLAIPPSMFDAVIRGLMESGCTPEARVIVEKPFGRDVASARELNSHLRAAFAETSIFRIDHRAKCVAPTKREDSMTTELDRKCVDSIRFLAVDMVEAARSGHPGLPMGAAPMAYVLWTRLLRHSPSNPLWWERDRFVLSAGHGSALLYALLHLCGYDLSLDQLRRFRSWGSLTPGHPESHLTTGVEATTGPLGQGVGNALGMAIAEAHLAARYNRPGHEIVQHWTYVLASDGDLMEGVQSEASSLAGHLGLGRLIVLYDNNHVTLSGSTSITFSEDVLARHRAYGWHVQTVADGNDLGAIERALDAAKAVRDRPSLISVQTVIGYGAPEKQGTFEAHGSPLGNAEVVSAKNRLGWPVEPTFHIPTDVLAHFRGSIKRGQALEYAWHEEFATYTSSHPELARELARRLNGALPEHWMEDAPAFPADSKGVATRKASERVLQHIAQRVPEVIGGSGDLDPSTYTWLKHDGDFEAPSRPREKAQGRAGGGWSYAGRNIHFGVREHAMAAAVNGLAYHGGFRPFAATFLVFSDYMRPAIRLAALAKLPSIFVFTHDSIGLGEDGPSHQPIEHLAALRAIPNLVVLRPCDANETRCAWQVALEQRTRPTAIVLTRQSVATIDRNIYAPAEELAHGAYVLDRAVESPDVVLIASGSEVGLIIAAAPIIRAAGVKARLVSIPSWRLFEEQSAEYRERVLPERVTARVAVEAASPFGWERWTGARGTIIGIDRFGASAPGEVVLEKLGFTADAVAQRALALVRGKGSH